MPLYLKFGFLSVIMKTLLYNSKYPECGIPNMNPLAKSTNAPTIK